MQAMIVFATREEIRQIVWRTKATPTLAEASQTIHLNTIIAVNANLWWHCTSTQLPLPPSTYPMLHWYIVGVWVGWEAEEDLKIAHDGEKLSWCKVNSHVVVGDGVCAAHSGDTATGIRGNGRGGHPRDCGDGESAVWGSAAAAAGGRSSGLSGHDRGQFLTI